MIHVRRADMQSIDAFMHINNVIGNEDDPASLIWQLSYIDSCHFYNITTSLISDLNSSFCNILNWKTFYKWALASFGYFQTNIITIFSTSICKKCPSSIQCQDLNSKSLEHKSPPITTRPVLPPNFFALLIQIPKFKFRPKFKLVGTSLFHIKH